MIFEPKLLHNFFYKFNRFNNHSNPLQTKSKMVEVGVRIKTEPTDADENNQNSNNGPVAGHHLQSHNSVNSNIGNSFLNSCLKELNVNCSSRCCNGTNCTRSKKENCLQGAYESKQATTKRLLKAIQSNDFEHLKRLLESKPDLNVLVNGQTVLHYCLLMGRDVNWAKQLVNCGANPNQTNNEGWHPIHLAAFNGLQDTLSYLITIKQEYQY